MSDKPENAETVRFWALILVLPALAAFLGMLAKFHLHIRLLALASGDTQGVWAGMAAPMVMSLLIAMLFLAVQMAVVGRIYRIAIFPVRFTWRSSVADKPLIQSASSVALVAVTAGIALALWAAPFVVPGKTHWAGFTTFLVATAILAGLIVAPMIVHGERSSTAV